MLKFFKALGKCKAFCALKLASKENRDLNLLDQSKFDSLWAEWRFNFSNNGRPKLILSITFNFLKFHQNEFLEQWLFSIDNSPPCKRIPIILLGNYDIYHLIFTIKNLDSVNLPYGFAIASPVLPTPFCKTTKTNIDYILTENIADDRCFAYDSSFKTKIFGSIFSTRMSIGKEKSVM